MCCGPETPSSGPRVGARVDLFSTTLGPLGSLLFLDPASPDSPMATHVRFAPLLDSQLIVSIHSTGDLSRDIPLLQQFRLPAAGRRKDALAEAPLEEPLALGVGGKGIIGRRVTVREDGSAAGGLWADGIVGFNSFALAPASC